MLPSVRFVSSRVADQTAIAANHTLSFMLFRHAESHLGDKCLQLALRDQTRVEDNYRFRFRIARLRSDDAFLLPEQCIEPHRASNTSEAFDAVRHLDSFANVGFTEDGQSTRPCKRQPP